jgi:hypothetical protein
MRVSVSSVLVLVLLIGVLIGSGVVFVSVPDGWNLIPLGAMVLAVLGLARALRAPAAGPAETATGPATDVEASEATAAGVPSRRLPDWVGRLNRAFGPILAGLLIDLVDLSTFGPIGLVLGMPLGGLAGYWMASCLGLSRWAALGCALAAGVYCTIPGTEVLPLATLVGAFARFQQGGRIRPEG